VATLCRQNTGTRARIGGHATRAELPLAFESRVGVYIFLALSSATNITDYSQSKETDVKICWPRKTEGASEPFSWYNIQLKEDSWCRVSDRRTTSFQKRDGAGTKELTGAKLLQPEWLIDWFLFRKARVKYQDSGTHSNLEISWYSLTSLVCSIATSIMKNLHAYKLIILKSVVTAFSTILHFRKRKIFSSPFVAKAKLNLCFRHSSLFRQWKPWSCCCWSPGRCCSSMFPRLLPLGLIFCCNWSGA